MDAVIDQQRLEQRIASLEEENARLARMLTDGVATRGAAASSLLHARVAELERELAESRAEAAEAGEREVRALEALNDVTDSPSWQLTAPLRAIKHALSRKG